MPRVIYGTPTINSDQSGGGGGGERLPRNKGRRAEWVFFFSPGFSNAFVGGTENLWWKEGKGEGGNTVKSPFSGRRGISHIQVKNNKKKYFSWIILCVPNKSIRETVEKVSWCVTPSTRGDAQVRKLRSALSLSCSTTLGGRRRRTDRTRGKEYNDSVTNDLSTTGVANQLPFLVPLRLSH